MAAALRAIGRQVLSARNSLGISQSALEKLTGLDQTTISRVERGLAPSLPLERLARLFAALGTNLEVGADQYRHGALTMLEEDTPDDEAWRSLMPRRLATAPPRRKPMPPGA